MKQIKRFFKELKRVRWPTSQETSSSFWKSLLFIIIASLALFGLALGVTAIWQAIGLGV